MTISEQEIKYIIEVDWPQDTPLPIPFPLNKKEDLKIQEDGSLLIYGVDYEVNEYKTEVIVKNRTLTKGSVLFRKTPLTQEAEFPQNNKFNSAKLNEALDKIMMQQQEQAEQIGRTFKLGIGFVDTNFNPTLKNVKENGIVKVTEDGTELEVSDYSPESIIEETKQYAEEAKYIEENIENKAEEIQEDIELAERRIAELEHILDKVAVGLSSETFNLEDWAYNNETHLYEYTITKLLMVVAVFEGNVFDKKLVSNVTIHNTEDAILLESITPFNGAVIGTLEIIETEEELYTTSELLNRMLEVEIIDITRYNNEEDSIEDELQNEGT